MEQDFAFLEMVKHYPILYTSGHKMSFDDYKKYFQGAWKDVAEKLRLSVEECQQRWRTIKYDYAIVKYLIDNGRISSKLLLRHHNIQSPLGEILNFLSEFLDDISDSDLSPSALERVNKLLCLDSSLQVKKEMNSNDDEQSPPVISDIPIESNSDESLRLGLGLESEFMIEENIKTEPAEADIETDSVENVIIPDPIVDADGIINTHVESDVMAIENYVITEFVDNDIKIEPVENVEQQELDPILCLMESNSTQPLTSVSNTMDKPMDNNMETTVFENPTDVSNTNQEINVSDADIRRFFHELGEVLNLELAYTKQKILQDQINHLLKEEFNLNVDTSKKKKT